MVSGETRGFSPRVDALTAATAKGTVSEGMAARRNERVTARVLVLHGRGGTGAAPRSTGAVTSAGEVGLGSPSPFRGRGRFNLLGGAARRAVLTGPCLSAGLVGASAPACAHGPKAGQGVALEAEPPVGRSVLKGPGLCWPLCWPSQGLSARGPLLVAVVVCRLAPRGGGAF